MIKVNGKELAFPENKTYAEFLEDSGYNVKRVALELNGDILPKAEFATTQIRDNDQVEIVCFVGGG